MQKHRDLTLQRLATFASDSGLRSGLYPQKASVALSVYHAPDRITYAEAMQGQYEPLSIGYQFGPFWSTHWVKVEIAIPQDWAGKEVHFLWDSTSEGCVWQDGQPLQGLTGSGTGWANRSVRPEFILTKSAKGGETLTLYVEVAVNTLFGIQLPVWPNDTGLLRQAEIGVFDRDLWDLLWDFQVLSEMAANLPANTPRGAQALYAANEMINAFRWEDRATWKTAREIAARYFADRNGGGQFNLSAIGHAHIDTAWLWPLAETRRKCVRTFTSALRYMDEYPSYKFACSQAQQYEWIKESQPVLYEKIKEKAKEGRFIPAGGSWVEPDCNIPSGEALVRQFLFGQRFFKKEFGWTCTEFWEPDVFGYSAALPQILRGSGISRFLTIKLSWNQFNKLQSHSFWWEGIDGSKVLTHFPPGDTYNSEANVKEVLFSMSNYKDLDRSKDGYLLFGFGDGGGGPTPAMIEQLDRMQDVDGLPRVEQRAPAEFFDRLETSDDLLTWVGELYFELHRGTYTTQARNKRYNRKTELLLRDVEFLSAMALVKQGAAYPAESVNGMWKKVLTNQFHDIIPGSSIQEVYVDSTADYEEILTVGADLREKAIDALAGGAQGEQYLVVNTLDHARQEVVELPGAARTAQVAASGKPLAVVSAPALGYAVVKPGATDKAASIEQAGDKFILKNGAVQATLTQGGSLVSLVELSSGRELIAAGGLGNHFVLFDDNPANWDAWDVDVFHLEKRDEVAGAASARLIEAGPLRVAVEFEYQLSPVSTLKQVVSLDALSSKLDFNTDVDWHEAHKFLKVEFPWNLRAQTATYEIQFGRLERPTHFNTSWDMARFEVVGHKWADLSEPDFGVTLYNDCKYGYATQGNVMRLSLLRSPKLPDPTADMGSHTFRYAVAPHNCSINQANVVHEGYDYNAPLLVRPTQAEPASVSYFQIDQPAVIIDTVKKAEDSDEIVVRLYEATGRTCAARLTSSLPVASAERCNLLEETEYPVEWNDGVSFSVRPFELLTFKIKLS